MSWITVPYWWHATVLELLWLAGGVLAMSITSANLVDAWKDSRALAEIREDPAMHDRHYAMVELAAKNRISAQWYRMAVSALIIIPGAYGCYTPNPLQGRTTWLGLVLTACLDAIAALTAWKAWSDMRTRNRMYDLAMGRSTVIAAKLREKHLNKEAP